MKTVYLALLVTFLTILLPTFWGTSLAWTVLPGLALGIGVFVFLNRKYGKLVNAIVEEANQEVQNAQMIMQRAQLSQNIAAQRAAQQTMEKKSAFAVKKLEEGLAYSEWQIGSKSSLNAQIGMLIFSNNIFLLAQGQKNKLKDAIPYLEKSIVKGWRAIPLQGLWHAWIRLAVCYFKTNKGMESVKEVMEGIVTVAKKEGFAWSVYAWFLMQSQQTDQAIEVLVRGAALSSDPILKSNLHALQNGKSLKMSDYGQMWLGLGLEIPKHLTAKQQSMGHPRMKGNRYSRR